MIEAIITNQSYPLFNTYEDSSEIKLSRGEVLKYLDMVSNPLSKDYSFAEDILHSYYRKVLNKVDFEYLKSLKPKDTNTFLTDHEIEFLNYIDKWDISSKNFPKYMILKKGIDVQELLIKLYENNFIKIVSMYEVLDLISDNELEIPSSSHKLNLDPSKEYFLETISSDLVSENKSEFFEKEFIVLTNKSRVFTDQYYNTKLSSKHKKICNEIEILEVVLNCNFKRLDIKESKKILDKLIYLSNIIDNNRGLINYSIQYFTISILENDLNIYMAKSKGVSDETIDFLYGNKKHQIKYSPKYSDLLKNFLDDNLLSIEDILTAVYYYSNNLPVDINYSLLSKKITNILK